MPMKYHVAVEVNATNPHRVSAYLVQGNIVMSLDAVWSNPKMIYTTADKVHGILCPSCTYSNNQLHTLRRRKWMQLL